MAEHEAAATEQPHDAAHSGNDNAVILGREWPFPIYTAVFIGLGALTLIEIALSQIPRGWLSLPLLLIIAITKAGLVVWFYMHLGKDSRVFAVAILLPFFLVVLATLFLMLVPVGY